MLHSLFGPFLWHIFLSIGRNTVMKKEALNTAEREIGTHSLENVFIERSFQNDQVKHVNGNFVDPDDDEDDDEDDAVEDDLILGDEDAMVGDEEEFEVDMDDDLGSDDIDDDDLIIDPDDDAEEDDDL
jgi:hypothetical protein